MSGDVQKILDYPYNEPGATPYLLFAERGGLEQHRLYVLGSNHFNDSSDVQYPVALGLWQHYVSYCLASQSPAFCGYEGGKRMIKPTDTVEQALRRYGEQAMFIRLSQRDNVRAGSLELAIPPKRMSTLVDRHTAPLLAYFLYMRSAPQYLRALDQGINLDSYDTYSRSRMVSIQGMRTLLSLGFVSLDLSQGSLDLTHRSLFPGTPLDPAKPLSDGLVRTPADYTSILWPYGVITEENSLTPLHRVGLDVGSARLASMRMVIADGWRRGNTLFCSIGTPHAIALGEILHNDLDVKIEKYIGAAACEAFLEHVGPSVDGHSAIAQGAYIRPAPFLYEPRYAG